MGTPSFFRNRFQQFNIAVGIVSLMFAISGCHKNSDTSQNGTTPIGQLRFPSAFNWEASRAVSLSAGITMLPSQIGNLCRISVFDGDPLKGGKLLATGSAGYGSPFETRFNVASSLSYLYLKGEDGGAFSLTDSVKVSGQVTYNFTQSSLKSIDATTSDPDCSGATPSKTLSGNQAVSLTNGSLYYVTDSFTGTINFGGSGASINVCGTLHPAAINNMNANCMITVTQGGSFIYDGTLTVGDGTRITAYGSSHVQLGGLTMNGTTARLRNYCNDWVIGSAFSPNGFIENYGTLVLNSDLNINVNSGTFVTTSSITVGGNLNINSVVTNNGPIEVFGSLNLNNATFYHNCKLLIHQNLNLNSGNLTMNGAYLKEFGELQVNQGATLLLKNNSMISTATYKQSTDIQGTGGRSEIKISGSGQIIGTNKVSGSIETITPSGTLTSGGSANFINGATLTSIAAAKNVLQVSTCNPEGVGGNPPPTDTDGDGIANSLDQYPSDPTRAFDNYYPSQTAYGTLVFEDLWPAMGDYDLNDLVLDYRVQNVTNALNNVVDIKINYYVRAAGAGYSNGFGFQLDGVLPGQIASVTGYSLKNSYISLAGSGVENGQQQAVIIVFDDFNNVIHRNGSGTFFNTLPGEPKGTADTVKINIHMASPLAQSIVGTAPFNPFLIKNKDRSIEIHLADKPPTSLANTALFGTSADNSSITAGRYYKTSNNLPWGLNLPVAFDYVTETTPINVGYLFFVNWAQSGGVNYPDWYTGKSGYRNTNYIYQAK